MTTPKELKVESEHALFVAKCIYEKAKEDVDTRAGGLLHGWLSLAKLREICNQTPSGEDTIAKLQEEVERLKEAFDTAHNTNLYLQAQLQSAKKQGGWVSVNDGLPEKKGMYLWFDGVVIMYTHFNPELDTDYFKRAAVMWQEITPPPKPDENKDLINNKENI